MTTSSNLAGYLDGFDGVVVAGGVCLLFVGMVVVAAVANALALWRARR